MEKVDYEVVVVGAGIVGSATAYYLSRELGNTVLLLEQFDFLHRKGSSHGDSRITRYSYPQDYYTELMFDAYKFWEEAEKESGSKVFTQTGGLDFGRADNTEILNVIENNKKFGVEQKIFTDTASISKAFPMVKLLPGHLAVWTPKSGILNATKSVAMFQRLARQRGCNLRDNLKVENISQNSSSGIITITVSNGEKISTKKCIIASGAWTNKVLKKAVYLELPLHVTQTTVAYWEVENAEEYSSRKFPVYINYGEPFLYGFPSHEFPGLIKCCSHIAPGTDPDKRSFDPDMPTLLNKISPWLQNFFTGVNPTPQMTESCMYTNSPDNDYIIDEVPGFKKGTLLVGCGFSGHGFKLGPVTGKMLATWAMTEKFPYSERIKQVFSIKRFDKFGKGLSKL